MSVVELQEQHMRGEKPDVALVPRCWIAGGCVRRWFVGGKQESDIDVFCETDAAGEEFVKANGLNERIRNDRMVMFFNSPIQLILQPRYTGGMEELIDHFDFTLCQFAYDGKRIISTTNAITSVLRKHLGVHRIQPGYEIDSLRRAFKYRNSGYKPCIGTIRDLANALNQAPAENLRKFDTISPERWD